MSAPSRLLMWLLSRGRRPGALTILVVCCASLVGLSSSTLQVSTDLDRDEEVIFFPALAVASAGASWVAHVDGWIFERRSGFGAIGELKKFLKERFGLTEPEFEASTVFRERARMFFVDNERNQRVAVSLLDSSHRLVKSTPAGQILDQIVLASRPAPATVVRLRALPKDDDDTRVFEGTVLFADGDGISVISDIDDTIKHSDVLNRRELAANTFLRPFTPVPGMADLYRRWASAGDDVVFHYLSGSPRQLYPALAQFAVKEGFPEGTFTLRPFRWSDRSAVEFIENRTMEFKLAAIERLMKMFPGRRFVFVGDSGEMDPEIYATAAARSPAQVAAIFIRAVREDHVNSARLTDVFASLPATIARHVFRSPDQIATVVLR